MVGASLVFQCIFQGLTPPSGLRFGTHPDWIKSSMSSPEIEKLTRALHAYKGLVEVSTLINAITDFDELLSSILEVARRVMRAEASSLLLADTEGNLRLTVARGPDGESHDIDTIVPRGQGVAGWVLANGRSALVPDAYADPRFFREVDQQTGFKTRSILCVPLTRNGAEIGVLEVLNPVDKDSFEEADLEAFEAYAALAATAIEKLRALERRRAQERLAQELALAHEIQNSFLPPALPDLPGMSFGVTYRPASNIGGDFYGVLRSSPEEIYFTVGDVAGKGIPAALLMAQTLCALRLIVQPGLAPAKILSHWNDLLCGSTVRGMFITALIGRILPPQHLIEIASAGHLPPWRVRADGGAEELSFKTSPPVGIEPGLEFQSHTFTLAPREFLVLFTDGLTESFNPQGDLLGPDGLARLLRPRFGNAPELVEALISGEAAHRQDGVPRDDLTILSFGFQ